MRKLTLFAFLVTGLFVSCGQGSDCGNTFTQVNKHMSPFDSEGKAVIFSAEGEGQIENFYFAGDMGNWHNPGKATLNVYCDGELSLSGKLYELACMNMDFVEEDYWDNVYVETPLYCKLGRNNSINLNFKIPYYKNCKVELVQADPSVKDEVWTTVRATDKVCLSYGGRRLPKGAYFRAIRTENKQIESGEFYTLMETDKNSMLIGMNMFMNSETPCTQEACLRAFDKRDDSATFISSGLEDFFLGTYYFDSGQFMRYNIGQTYLQLQDTSAKFCAYRMFTDNPICFDHPVRLTVRNGDNDRITQDSEPTDDIAYGRGKCTFGAFCFYYEW